MTGLQMCWSFFNFNYNLIKEDEAGGNGPEKRKLVVALTKTHTKTHTHTVEGTRLANSLVLFRVIFNLLLKLDCVKVNVF